MEWIKVSNRLPSDGEIVLCIDQENEIFVAEYTREKCFYEPYYFDTWNSGHCCGNEKGDAIYWMPLPSKPPKENP